MEAEMEIKSSVLEWLIDRSITPVIKLFEYSEA